jgi:hypothetical protein
VAEIPLACERLHPVPTYWAGREDIRWLWCWLYYGQDYDVLELEYRQVSLRKCERLVKRTRLGSGCLGLPAVGNAEGLGIGAEAVERQGGALEFIPGLEERKMLKVGKARE